MNFSIDMRWKEMRYINCEDSECIENKERGIKCPTNTVLWWENSQFWLPRLFVKDALELVTCLQEFVMYNFCLIDEYNET